MRVAASADGAPGGAAAGWLALQTRHRGTRAPRDGIRNLILTIRLQGASQGSGICAQRESPSPGAEARATLSPQAAVRGER
jgi:hypothetical protein